MSVPLGLLHFRETYFERVWGGTKLRAVYGKQTPEGKVIGESWLISDHATCESVVAEGALAGETLHALLSRDARAILGERARVAPGGRFPLLFKLLDAGDRLSVQVHPDDACAERLGEPDVGKTEMWHILDAAPDSTLICGLDAAVTPERFAEAVADDVLEQLLTPLPVTEGTSVFVPAGVVHAIGAGILLAEIQQNSDLTYRIHDFCRVEANGAPRALHIEKAAAAIHFGSARGGDLRPLACEEKGARRMMLAACPHFAAELVEVRDSVVRHTRGDSFHILLAKEGTLSVEAGRDSRAARAGEAVLVPGVTRSFVVNGTGSYLDYYVPEITRDIVEPLRRNGHSDQDISGLVFA